MRITIVVVAVCVFLSMNSVTEAQTCSDISGGVECTNPGSGGSLWWFVGKKSGTNDIIVCQRTGSYPYTWTLKDTESYSVLNYLELNGRSTSDNLFIQVTAYSYSAECNFDTFPSIVKSTIYGNGGDDNIKGSNSPDFIYGGEGDDDIYGLGGDDYLSGGNGFDDLWGEGGDDILDCDAEMTTGDENLFGGTGDDELYCEISRDHHGHCYGEDQDFTDYCECTYETGCSP